MNEDPVQDKPQDLSMKANRKIKPIPPPLDLNARTFDNEAGIPPPKSPGDLPRECLPLRKRALVEVRKDLVCKSPKSAGLPYYPAPSSPLSSAPPRLPLPTTSLTPSSGSSHTSAFTHFPVPPPLIAPAVAAAAAAVAAYPKSPYLPPSSGSGFPTPPTELHSPYPWASPIFSPFNTFTTSALLSPAPSSYPSSTNSSREDLPPVGGEQDSKRRLLSSGSYPPDSTSPVPSSPLLSPRTWSHSWPTPAWQCFVGGTMVRFILPNLDTPWQKVEELGWKDRLAMKVDSKNLYQYAPYGLVVVKIDVISREVPRDPSKFSSGDSEIVLRLRMAPHRGDNSPEILADCSLDHPFFVKEKGWSSAQARLAIEKYGIPCQELSVGDVCLPPNHPEAVRTPDLCDRFRRFEFNTESTEMPHSPLAILNAARAAATRSHQPPSSLPPSSSAALNFNPKMSPPLSPAKPKKEKDPDKPKRPMNGFMLFAKKYRLELIQQHPGKDNRAISVLLGEAWKSLPQDERDNYSSKAKVMADEQKKLHPDCWKRKRTVNNSTSSAASTPTTSSPNTPNIMSAPTQHFFDTIPMIHPPTLLHQIQQTTSGP